jgi:hypothetical protein
VSAEPAFRDRIKELRRVKASDLVPNPKNWRRHPGSQTRALRAMLKDVGFADALIAREAGDGTLVMLDGHLRAGLDPEQLVPVLVLDVSEEEGDKILATLDPLAGMAKVDPAMLDDVRKLIEDKELNAVLERLASDARLAALVEAGGSPELDSAFGEGVDERTTETVKCPTCGQSLKKRVT